MTVNNYPKPTEADLLPGYKHIVQHPNYMSGEPALLGLRMRPVAFIKMLEGGWTQERLIEEYKLTEEVFEEIYRFMQEDNVVNKSKDEKWTKSLHANNL